MPGRILIVDDVPTHRIVLKVKLAAASYDVSLAESLPAARAMVAAQEPSLVLISDGIGSEGTVTRFCAELRAALAGKGTAVLAALREGCASRRLDLLRAGADEVIEFPVEEGVLLARVRSLLRQRAEQALPALPELGAFGMAEAPAGFERPGLICLVSGDAALSGTMQRRLGGRLPDKVIAVSRANTLDRLRTGPVPDLFVIAADPPGPADLRLLAELRARQETATAPVVICGGAPAAETQIMALDLGAGDVLPAEVEAEELVYRLRLRLRQKRDCDSRRARLAQGLQLALTDPLTGLANRRAAFARLAAMAEGAAAAKGLALMILDIDRFKSINDRFGHLAGDRVLAEVARRLTANLRDRDLAARIGGEEFLVVLPDTPLVPARLAAERLRRAVEADAVPLGTGESAFVTLSIGLCMGPGANETIEDALNRADQALYAAKARGRNTVTISQSVA